MCLQRGFRKNSDDSLTSDPEAKEAYMSENTEVSAIFL